MNKWNEQYTQAAKVLAVAHAADLAAYEAIPLESKSFWAERSCDCWPKVESFRAWAEARQQLLAAETTVVEVLRWRCVAIRLGLPMNSIAPKHASLVAPPYLEQRHDTVPCELNPADYLLPRSSAGTTAPSYPH